jgi:small-conductance mechanosensitive channel
MVLGLGVTRTNQEVTMNANFLAAAGGGLINFIILWILCNLTVDSIRRFFFQRLPADFWGTTAGRILEGILTNGYTLTMSVIGVIFVYILLIRPFIFAIRAIRNAS